MVEVGVSAVNLGAEIALSAVRALLVAGVTLAIAVNLDPWLAPRRGSRRTFVWTLLLALFLAPALLLAFGFFPSSGIPAFPLLREMLYPAALVLKLLPLAVIAGLIVPGPLSPKARCIHRSLRRTPVEDVRFRFRAAAHGLWIAGALVFVGAFVDFEVAAICGVRTWVGTTVLPQIHDTPLLTGREILVNLGLVIGGVWLTQSIARRNRGTLPLLGGNDDASHPLIVPVAAEYLWQLEAVTLEPARLTDVSLTIPRGVTAVIGAPGAGKTSLLNLLAGFEKPDRGQITGSPGVAWVPGDDALWPHCTVREHLEIARGSADGIDALLADLDLTERRERMPHALSVQECARLAVARALATSAEAIVMDDPLAHVDPTQVGRYWNVIHQHLARSGASLVFSPPAPETAIAEAEHALCLRAGRLVHAGPVARLYTEPPDEDLMTFLGPGNWLTPAEARRWFRAQLTQPRCLRPEQILITPSSEGPLRVEVARFSGAFGEAVLRHVPSNATRTFFHRPPRAELQAGDFVQLSEVLAP